MTVSSILQPDESKVSHQAAWVVGCRIISIGCTTASSFLIARILGPDGFGVFLLTTTILGFGYLLGTAGLDVAGLRFVSENLGLKRYRKVELYLKTTKRWASVSTLLAAVIVVVTFAVFRRFANYTEISMVAIFLIGTGVMALAWQQLSSQLLRGLNDIRSASFYSGGQTGGPLSNLIFTIPLAIALAYSVSLSTIHVIALLVGSICLTLPFALRSIYRASQALASSAANEEKHQLSGSESRTLRGVAASMLVIQLLAFITVQADIWIGSSMLMPRDFGFYGAAKRAQLIAHMPLQMALMTIQGTIPRLFAQGRVSELERIIRSATTWSSLIAMPVLLLLVAFPTQVLTLCFGETFAGASPIVLPLAVGMLALLFFGNPAGVLSITGNHGIVLRVNILSAVALLLFGVLGAYLGGAFGLAIGSSAATILQNVILWYALKKRLGICTHVGRMSLPGSKLPNSPKLQSQSGVETA